MYIGVIGTFKFYISTCLLYQRLIAKELLEIEHLLLCIYFSFFQIFFSRILYDVKILFLNDKHIFIKTNFIYYKLIQILSFHY